MGDKARLNHPSKTAAVHPSNESPTTRGTMTYHDALPGDTYAEALAGFSTYADAGLTPEAPSC